MRTPHSTQYQYTQATIDAANRLTPETVSEHEHKKGMLAGEPLIVMMDALVQYADAYRSQFERTLKEDYFLGPEWLSAATSVRALLNGNGAEAMRRGITRDSKDNGAVETVFWQAMAKAGFDESDI